MNTRPRLTRSIPFWLLVAGSLASSAAGAVVLIDKLGTMETALTAGTATGVEVYVGQIWAVLGAILIGVGAIGLLLAFMLGALRAFAVTPQAQTAPEADDAIEPVDQPEDHDTTEPVLDGAAR
ncbi:dinucleotide-utilizing enzyme [Microbacterium sp. LMI1x-1-1.1]|uniref:dinucleotide-utilizing enzyme n=1 Tax=Microbacterium sp. LMI1x-1-1.1 TaxID=3135246 RepID=UPI00341FDD33